MSQASALETHVVLGGDGTDNRYGSLRPVVPGSPSEVGPRLRIAILGTRGYPSTYGGFETFVRRLAPWLVERGHDVTVYGHGEGERTDTYVDGVRAVMTRGLSGKSSATATHGLSGAVHALRSETDVVLAMNIANGPSAALLRMSGIPVVLNVDGIEWERAKWGRLAKLAFRGGARVSAWAATELVADALEIQRVWVEKFGVRPTFIPYGADLDDADDTDRLAEVGVERDRFVLAVARLAPENNVDLLLDALEGLESPVQAVVVGSANYPNPLEARLQRLQSDGRLVWLGHVSDQGLLSQLWRGCGAYFHGHSVGGTNPALLQALAHGAPTVAVRTPYNREVIGHEDQLVDACPKAVGEAVSSLLADLSRRRVLADRGRATVDDRYDWQSVLEAYETALMRCAVQGRQPITLAI